MTIIHPDTLNCLMRNNVSSKDKKRVLGLVLIIIVFAIVLGIIKFLLAEHS